MSERVIVRQGLQLTYRSVNKPALAEAQRCTPQARESFDVFLSGVVYYPNALTTDDDEGTTFAMFFRFV